MQQKLILAALLWLPLQVAHAGERVALLVANNSGLAHEVPLRHTGDDARRLRGVLQELGHFETDDVVLLVEQSAEQVLTALRALTARPDAKMLFFYYSGHADAASLHLGGTRLPMDTVLEALNTAHSPLQIAVLDACQSGGASRPKGSRPGPAFEVQVREPTITGQIVITSSADDEQSYESDVERGALFTTHFISGLRGAADRNMDGQVTLAEAYAYAYANTLRDTLLSGGGPQHPSFRWGFAARQEPVLTYLHSDAHLTLRSAHDGVFVVFTAAERDVLAELPLRQGEQTRLALAAGSYVVKKQDTEALRAAQVELATGDDRLLLDQAMVPVPYVRLAQKGGLGVARLFAGVGQINAAVGAPGAWQGDIGVGWDTERFDYGVRLLFSQGSESHAGLATRDSYIGPGAYAQRAWSYGPYVRLGVGPSLGVLYFRQQSQSHAPVHSTVGRLGAAVQLQTRLTPRLELGLRGEFGGMLARADGALPTFARRAGSVALVPFATYSVDVHFLW